MNTRSFVWVSLIAVLLTAGLVKLSSGQQVSDKSLREKIKGDYIRPSTSPAEIIRARGFIAKEFYFTTHDGYKINIVRGTNPLINGGRAGLRGTLPILFVSGTTTSASVFLASSLAARPRNFRKWINLREINDSDELYELLDNDPSIKSLPFLAMNFGYEVWMVNRRGFGKSRGRVGHENRTLADAIKAIPDTLLFNGFHPLASLKPGRPQVDNGESREANSSSSSSSSSSSDGIPHEHEQEPDNDAIRSFWKDLFLTGLSLDNLPGALTDFGKFRKEFIETFDPEYWDFSLDEQAQYDVPESVDFVLKHTGKRMLHTVGLSSGGALILMAAAENRKLHSKIASAILWAPSLNMGSAQDIVYQLSQLATIVQSYSGPIFFTFMHDQIIGIIQNICSTDHAQRNLCARLFDFFFGYSGHTSPTRISIIAFGLESTSAHELTQLGQFAHTTQPCKLNYNDPKKNLEVYGQLEPPCYDLSRVKLRNISIFAGSQDRLISPADINITRSQLGVDSKLYMIDGEGINFNHIGTILHEQADRLANLPSLLDMERAQAGIISG
uniref:Lipase member K n=1 Tax=Aceria tosichella TaxID=561515 RepID=A0A6G1SND1_9ACAR